MRAVPPLSEPEAWGVSTGAVPAAPAAPPPEASVPEPGVVVLGADMGAWLEGAVPAGRAGVEEPGRVWPFGELLPYTLPALFGLGVVWLVCDEP